MDTSARHLLIVAGLNFLGFVVIVIGGFAFGSIALISNGLHDLFDALSYVMAFGTTWIATNRDTTERWTYGFHRLEVGSAFINGSMLLPMAFAVIYEAYQRFQTPVDLAEPQVIGMAVFGLAINLVSVYILHRDEMSLNEQGAFVHLLTDTGGSVAVIIGTTAIMYTGRTIIDPIIAIILALLVIWSASNVLRESIGILMQRSPIPASDIEATIETIDGVDDAHDVRIWEVCSQVCVATAHATIDVEDFDEAEQLREQIIKTLKDTYLIDHVTIQIEGEQTNQATSHDHDHH